MVWWASYWTLYSPDPNSGWIHSGDTWPRAVVPGRVVFADGYRLAPTSAGHGAGSPDGASASDITGAARTGPDHGAYQPPWS